MQCDGEHGCYEAMVDGFRFVYVCMTIFVTVPTVEKMNYYLGNIMYQSSAYPDATTANPCLLSIELQFKVI